MAKETQISAFVSASTKHSLEQYVRMTGLKKGHFIEAALQHHFVALQNLPTDVIMTSRLVLSKASGEKLLKRLGTKPAPTKVLKELFTKNED